MSKILLIFSVILPCVLLTACAANLSVKAASGSQVMNPEPSLTVQSARNYIYDYDQIVAGTAYNDVYVICRDCAPATKLDRELGDVPISVFWGKKKVVSEGSVSQLGQATELSQPKSLPVKPQQAQSETKHSCESSSNRNSDPQAHSSITSCVSSPILFDLDSAVLKDREKAKILASIDDLKKAKTISVMGYTCDLGSKEHNDRLALQRAQAVTAYLEDRGVKPSEVTGEGKCCYVSEDRIKNRRAEIYCRKPKGE